MNKTFQPGFFMPKQKFARGLHSFKESEDGAIAVMFAVVLMALIAGMMLAVEFNNRSRVQSDLEIAASAAASSLARSFPRWVEESRLNQGGFNRRTGCNNNMIAEATRYVRANLRAKNNTQKIQNLMIDCEAADFVQVGSSSLDTKTVEVRVSTDWSPLFFSLAPQRLSGSAVALAQSLGIEVSLVMDLSGSMSRPTSDPGKTRLDVAKESAKDFFSILIDGVPCAEAPGNCDVTRLAGIPAPQPSQNFFAIVPFSERVNVGEDKHGWLFPDRNLPGFTSTDWAAPVQRPERGDEDTVTLTPRPRLLEDFDTADGRGKWYGCVMERERSFDRNVALTSGVIRNESFTISEFDTPPRLDGGLDGRFEPYYFSLYKRQYTTIPAPPGSPTGTPPTIVPTTDSYGRDVYEEQPWTEDQKATAPGLVSNPVRGIDLYNEIGPNAMCGPSIQSLTQDRIALYRKIDELNYVGTTQTQNGMLWGWRTLSPKWQGEWGDSALPREDAILFDKIVVFLGDGGSGFFATPSAVIDNPDYEYSNFLHLGRWNSSEYRRKTGLPENGRDMTLREAWDAANDMFEEVCTAAKRDGNLEIWTIGFAIESDTDQINRLRRCASGSSFYRGANSASDLRATFQEIARRLQQVRLLN